MVCRVASNFGNKRDEGVAHFALGYIPEAAKLLRAGAGFLRTDYACQHVTMARRLRKGNVYQEVARLLDIPGGEQIVKANQPK